MHKWRSSGSVRLEEEASVRRSSATDVVYPEEIVRLQPYQDHINNTRT